MSSMVVGCVSMQWWDEWWGNVDGSGKMCLCMGGLGLSVHVCGRDWTECACMGAYKDNPCMSVGVLEQCLPACDSSLKQTALVRNHMHCCTLRGVHIGSLTWQRTLFYYHEVISIWIGVVAFSEKICNPKYCHANASCHHGKCKCNKGFYGDGVIDCHGKDHYTYSRLQDVCTRLALCCVLLWFSAGWCCPYHWNRELSLWQPPVSPVTTKLASWRLSVSVTIHRYFTALGQPCDCFSVSEATLKNMSKSRKSTEPVYMMWLEPNKALQNCMHNPCNILYYNTTHWHGNIILMQFLSLAAPEVAKIATFGAASDENFVKMTFPFQCFMSN